MHHQGLPFARGIATNVGGDKPGAARSSDGWHIAKAAGLPVRYITSIRMDPANPKTVYVTLGGYGRQLGSPGRARRGHEPGRHGPRVQVHRRGREFSDISGDLPDVPANWSVVHNGHLVVGTDLGVFESIDTGGGDYVRLGTGLPAVPISTLRFKPGDPDLLVAATYGRGVYTYDFRGASEPTKTPSPTAPGSGAASASSGTACAAAIAQRLVKARPVANRRRVRLTLPRVRGGQRVDIVQVSTGRHIYRERPIAILHPTGSFTWNGRAHDTRRRPTDGYYFVLVRGAQGAGPHHGLSRVVLQRSHGRFTVRPDFFLRGGCGALNYAKFERPVFGGAQRYPLRFTYQLKHAARVSMALYRGHRLVRSFGTHSRAAKRGYNVTVALRHLPKGQYTMVTRVAYRSQRVVVRLVSRRI